MLFEMIKQIISAQPGAVFLLCFNVVWIKYFIKFEYPTTGKINDMVASSGIEGIY
jgi:hypothetical protein